jgi:hypothetical protein
MYAGLFFLWLNCCKVFFTRASVHPSVKWGQKKDHILLTIAVQDIDKPEINIEPTKLQFK